MPSWPSSIWAPTTKIASVTTVAAAHMNDAQAEVVSLETEIGVNPRTIDDTVAPGATPATLAVFFDMVANLIKGITGKSNWYTAPAQTIADLLTGWLKDGTTWVFVSSASFKVTGQDVTGTYQVGTRLRWKQGGAYKYAYVQSSSFSTDTTVTINAGSDFTIANATITDNWYSYKNPQGFPEWFNYTPTGVSATNVTLTGRFRLLGTRSAEVYLHAAFAGAITFTTMPTLPFPAEVGLTTYDDGDTDLAQVGLAAYFDSGTATVIGTLFPNVPSFATTVTITTGAGANISATVPITWAANDQLSVRFSYEV